MHTVPQNNYKFTTNNIFYCCETPIFTQPLVYKFLCGLIFMGHPVLCRVKDPWFDFIVPVIVPALA